MPTARCSISTARLPDERSRMIQAGEAGAARGLADDPPSAVPIRRPPVGGSTSRGLADGQIDCSGGPRCRAALASRCTPCARSPWASPRATC
jgi:hypothetical protein